MAKNEKSQSEFVRWMGPLLDCLRAVGGSAKPKEVLPWIRERANLPSDALDFTLKSGQAVFTTKFIGRGSISFGRDYLTTASEGSGR